MIIEEKEIEPGQHLVKLTIDGGNIDAIKLRYESYQISPYINEYLDVTEYNVSPWEIENVEYEFVADGDDSKLVVVFSFNDN